MILSAGGARRYFGPQFLVGGTGIL